jgi:hypothetical protein
MRANFRIVIAPQAFRFRIELDGILPWVWPASKDCVFQLWDMHAAIQDNCGWLDCHLHEFPAGPLTISIPDE